MKKFLCLILCCMQNVIVPMQQSRLNPALIHEISQQEELHEVQLSVEQPSVQEIRAGQDYSDSHLIHAGESVPSQAGRIRVLHVAPVDRTKGVLLASAACAACCLVSLAIIIVSVLQEIRVK